MPEELETTQAPEAAPEEPSEIDLILGSDKFVSSPYEDKRAIVSGYYIDKGNKLGWSPERRRYLGTARDFTMLQLERDEFDRQAMEVLPSGKSPEDLAFLKGIAAQQMALGKRLPPDEYPATEIDEPTLSYLAGQVIQGNPIRTLWPSDQKRVQQYVDLMRQNPDIRPNESMPFDPDSNTREATEWLQPSYVGKLDSMVRILERAEAATKNITDTGRWTPLGDASDPLVEYQRVPDPNKQNVFKVRFPNGEEVEHDFGEAMTTYSLGEFVAGAQAENEERFTGKQFRRFEQLLGTYDDQASIPQVLKQAASGVAGTGLGLAKFGAGAFAMGNLSNVALGAAKATMFRDSQWFPDPLEIYEITAEKATQLQNTIEGFLPKSASVVQGGAFQWDNPDWYKEVGAYEGGRLLASMLTGSTAATMAAKGTMGAASFAQKGADALPYLANIVTRARVMGFAAMGSAPVAGHVLEESVGHHLENGRPIELALPLGMAEATATGGATFLLETWSGRLFSDNLPVISKAREAVGRHMGRFGSVVFGGAAGFTSEGMQEVLQEIAALAAQDVIREGSIRRAGDGQLYFGTDLATGALRSEVDTLAEAGAGDLSALENSGLVAAGALGGAFGAGFGTFHGSTDNIRAKADTPTESDPEAEDRAGFTSQILETDSGKFVARVGSVPTAYNQVTDTPTGQANQWGVIPPEEFRVDSRDKAERIEALGRNRAEIIQGINEAEEVSRKGSLTPEEQEGLKKDRENLDRINSELAAFRATQDTPVTMRGVASYPNKGLAQAHSNRLNNQFQKAPLTPHQVLHGKLLPALRMEGRLPMEPDAALTNDQQALVDQTSKRAERMAERLSQMAETEEAMARPVEVELEDGSRVWEVQYSQPTAEPETEYVPLSKEEADAQAPESRPPELPTDAKDGDPAARGLTVPYWTGNANGNATIDDVLEALKEDGLEVREDSVEWVWEEPSADSYNQEWSMRLEGGKIKVNLRNQDNPGQTRYNFRHELSHLAAEDAQVQAALADLSGVLSTEESAAIVAWASNYPKRARSAEAEAEIINILSQSAEGRSMWQKFVAAVRKFLSGISGKQEISRSVAEDIAARAVKASLRGLQEQESTGSEEAKFALKEVDRAYEDALRGDSGNDDLRDIPRGPYRDPANPEFTITNTDLYHIEFPDVRKKDGSIRGGVKRTNYDDWAKRNPKSHKVLEAALDAAAKIKAFDFVGMWHGTYDRFSSLDKDRMQEGLHAGTAASAVDRLVDTRTGPASPIYGYLLPLGVKIDPENSLGPVKTPDRGDFLAITVADDLETWGVISMVENQRVRQAHNAKYHGEESAFWKADQRAMKRALESSLGRKLKSPEEELAEIIGNTIIHYTNKSEDEGSTSFNYWGDTGNVKMTAPVTFDDAGEVIPPSRRFETQIDDLRYALSQGQPTRRYEGVDRKRLLESNKSSMYDKRIAETNPKELFQNARDAVEGMDDGVIGMTVSELGRGIKVWDNGRGMSPSQVVTMYLPAYASGKDASASAGGFGVANVGILGGSDRFKTTTVAEVGGRKLRTTISGDRDSYSNFFQNGAELPENLDVPGTYDVAGMPMLVEETDLDTGTTVEVDFVPEDGDMKDIGRSFGTFAGIGHRAGGTGFHVYSSHFNASGGPRKWSSGLTSFELADGTTVDGSRVTPHEWNYDASEVIDIPGAKITVWVGRGEPRKIWSVDIRNRGIKQFEMDLPSGIDVELPDIVIDVDPTVSTTDPQGRYPYAQNRDSLRGMADKVVRVRIMDIASHHKRVLAKKLDDLKASKSAIPNSENTFFDGTGGMDPESRDRVARHQMTRKLSRIFSTHFPEVAKASDRAARFDQMARHEDAPFSKGKFSGFMHGTGAFGVRLGSRQVGSEGKIWLDLGSSLSEAEGAVDPDYGFRDLVDSFAAFIGGVVIHELAHQISHSEGEGHARAMTFIAGAAAQEIVNMHKAIVAQVKPKELESYVRFYEKETGASGIVEGKMVGKLAKEAERGGDPGSVQILARRDPEPRFALKAGSNTSQGPYPRNFRRTPPLSENTRDVLSSTQRLTRDGTLSGSDKSFLRRARERLGGFIDDKIRPVSSVLAEIHPALSAAMRNYDWSIMWKTHVWGQAAEEFFAGYKKLSKGDRLKLDLMLANTDRAGAEAFADSKGFGDGMRRVFPMLEAVHKEASKYDRDIGYIPNYFPRQTKKGITLLELQGELRGLGQFDAYMAEIEKFQKRNKTVATEAERADIANNMLARSFASPSGRPKTARGRKVAELSEALQKYYEPSDKALKSYIRRMAETTEKRRFFGAANREELGRLDGDIGGLFADLHRKGQFTPEQVEKINSVIRGRAGAEPVTYGVLNVARDVGYMMTIANTISAITQFGDLAYAGYANGHHILPGMKPLKITKKDIGVMEIGTELSHTHPFHTLSNSFFTVSGFEAIDSLGKTTIMSGWAAKAASMPLEEFRSSVEQYEQFLQTSVEQVHADLQDANLTDDVRFLAFAELSRFQPISMTEMPQWYVNHPKGRILYMLKSFTIKQFDLLRREGISMMIDGTREARAGNHDRGMEMIRRGFWNTVRLTVMMSAAGAGADEIKQFILGREVKLGENVWNNVLKLFGLSRYHAEQLERSGPGAFSDILKDLLIEPPVFDVMKKGLSDVGTIYSQGLGAMMTQSKLMSMVPVGGKIYDAHWGLGSEREKKRIFDEMMEGVDQQGQQNRSEKSALLDIPQFQRTPDQLRRLRHISQVETLVLPQLRSDYSKAIRNAIEAGDPNTATELRDHLLKIMTDPVMSEREAYLRKKGALKIPYLDGDPAADRK